MTTKWVPLEERLIEGLTFDDVFVIPHRSEVHPREVDISTELCRGIKIATPFVSSPMDTVTEEKMVIAIELFGGAGVLHKGMSGPRLKEALTTIKRFMAGQIKNPIKATPDQTLRAVKSMNSLYTGFPVVSFEDGDKPKLLGIITRRDMDGKEPGSLVGESMTPRERLVVAAPDISFDGALNLMRRHKVEKLPLVDANDHLVGLVTRRDLDRRLKHPKATVDNQGRLRVGVAVSGANPESAVELVKDLIPLGLDFVVVDSAHGGNSAIIASTRSLKDTFSDLPVIAGNVADRSSAEGLIEAGCDALRVGVGPGSICSTRIVTGIGVPQITAVAECRGLVEHLGSSVPIIADGGISQSGQVIKALAAGASTVMLGNLLASTIESPGEVITRGNQKFKKHRGMGSAEAIKKYGGDRYFQEGDGESEAVIVPEGVSGTVPLRGTVSELLAFFSVALRNGMGYNGAQTISELWKARMVKVTAAGLKEAAPHDLISIESETSTNKQETGGN